MADIRDEANRDGGDPQVDPKTGRPVAIAPIGELSDGEIEDGAKSEEGKARIDPESRIPRPPQPDLA